MRNAGCGMRSKGKQEMVEKIQDEIIVDMVKMGLSSLSMHEVLLSERERQALHRVIYAFVTQSVEIEARIVMKLERTPAA